jgi:hypothetical protein
MYLGGRNLNRSCKLLIVLLLAACSPSPSQVTIQPTIAQTQAAQPVATDTPLPVASVTQEPTIISTELTLPTSTTIPPTATVASPAILSDYLINPSVASFDSFDTLGDWSTYNSQTGIITNGMFIITGQPGGMSGLVKNTRLAKGQGVLLDFQYNSKTQFEFIFDAGEPKTDSYRRLSVSGTGSPTAALTQGKIAIGTNRFTGNFLIKPGNWYGYMAGIGTKGNFVVIIWDKNDTAHLVKYQKTLGDKWDNLSWQFTAKVADKFMKLSLDNFSVINFDDVK